MALPLTFGLEPHSPERERPAQLHAVIGQLPHRPFFLAADRRRGRQRAGIRFEQMEFAAIVREARGRLAPITLRAERRLPRKGREPGVLELSHRGGQRLRVTTDDTGQESEPARRADGPEGAPELVVVAGAVRFDVGAQRSARAPRVGHVFGNHVDDAPEGIRAVQNARRTADQLDPVGEARLDRRAVFVAPGIVLEAIAVAQHQHRAPRKAADHRLADLAAGREGTTPARDSSAWASETRYSRARAAAPRLPAGSGEDSGSAGARVAVTVTASS